MRFLTFDELKPTYGHPWTRRHTERLVKEGKFPAPVKLGEGPGGRVAWVDEELDAHYARLAKSRNRHSDQKSRTDQLTA
jgi:predicted DNA-binding transcriptional regulator AlpA